MPLAWALQLKGSGRDMRPEVRVNKDRLQGNWRQVAGRIKQRWGRMTDDALREVEGRREELIGRIQEMYGISRDEAGRQARSRVRLH